MSKILRILSTTKKYGGDLFEDDFESALRLEHHQIDTFNPVPANGSKLQRVPEYFKNLKKIDSFKGYEFVFRAMNHPFYMSQSPKQVMIAYHYDTAFCHPLVKIHHYLTLKSIISNKDKIFKLVVISEYWRDFFHQLGFKNIEVIYCGFDNTKYTATQNEVNAFLDHHGLENKKVIYIGNAQKKKGADLVYKALKDTRFSKNFELVTSGNSDLQLPCRNLKLNFKEYLCLLKASAAVITFSQFKEGWNRVAHEAMLMGTPVIGSGFGGMGELLLGGGQKMVQNPNDLKKTLEQVLVDPELGFRGKEFALNSKFTIENFNQSTAAIFR